MRLNDQEKRIDFKTLMNTLKEIDIDSEFYEKGDLFEEMGLLIYLPDESISAKNKEEEKYNAAVCYMFELDDSEEQMNKYYLIYSEIDLIMNSVDELSLYKTVTEFNKKVPIGYFYVDTNENNNLKVKYRFTVTSHLGSIVDDGVFCEGIIQMIFYMSLMTDVLEGLINGDDVNGML